MEERNDDMLTEEECTVIYEVLTEKQDTLESNTKRALTRLVAYKKMSDCAILAEKARKTVDQNIQRIGIIDAIRKKIKIS